MRLCGSRCALRQIVHCVDFPSQKLAGSNTSRQTCETPLLLHVRAVLDPMLMLGPRSACRKICLSCASAWWRGASQHCNIGVVGQSQTDQATCRQQADQAHIAQQRLTQICHCALQARWRHPWALAGLPFASISAAQQPKPAAKVTDRLASVPVFCVTQGDDKQLLFASAEVRARCRFRLRCAHRNMPQPAVTCQQR